MNQVFPRSIWVSYASAQQELVDGLGEYIAKAPPDNNEREFQLQAYLKKGDNSKPQESNTTSPQSISWQTYLVTGEPIQLVIESIATSLRRVLVLSPAYIRSEYCLWELCSCLIYCPNNIFVILAGIADLDVFKARGKLDYCFDAVSLVDALCTVYELKKDSMHHCFHLEEGDEPAVYFEKRLGNLEQRLYQTTQNQSMQVLGDKIQVYAGEFGSDLIVGQFWSFLSRCFDQWCAHSSTKALLTTVEENQGLVFDDLKYFKKSKVNQFVKTITKDYRQSPTAVWLPSMYQFSAILALLRLNPEWVAEMRDANPGRQLLRISVPAGYDDEVRAIYETCLAASAIQFAPLELIPQNEKEAVPQVGGTLNIALPHEPMTGTSNRQRTKQIVTNELVCRVMDLTEDELQPFFKQKSDWRIEFRAQVDSDLPADNDVYTLVRFYFDQQWFTQKTNEHAIEVIREIMVDINQGAAQDRFVKIGVLQLLNKRDSEIEYVNHEDNLQTHIKNIFRCR